MRIELAERLRCPAAHAATPLIVVARRVDGRELIDGTAGCMTCHLEAVVTGGVLRIGAPHEVIVGGDAPDAPDATSPARPGEADLERAAALLGLAEPGGAVLLAGRYTALSAPLRERFDVMTAVIATRGDVPFVDGTFRAAAIDLPGVMIDEVVRAVAVGGRIVAPSSATVPAGLRELARDDREWVAAREATGPIVTLGRAGPPRTGSR